MTMAKLAELAGVSVSTVSKAFSGSREISEEKRAEIFRLAKENGCYDKYCKNTYAGLVIAVICPEYNSRFYTEMLSSLEAEIQKHDGTMIVTSSEFNPKRQAELLTFFSEYAKVDGIILLHPPKALKKYSIPIVVLGECEYYDCVAVSEQAAVMEAVQLLKQNGHRNIAFISERLTGTKRKLFEYAMRQNGLPLKEEYLPTEDSRFESAGYHAMNRLLSLAERPTAVVAAYDNVAIGAMKSISEHGLKIPEDISIVGFDDIKELPYLEVPLTSVTSYHDDLCQIMVELLLERIKRPEDMHITKKIKVSKQLVRRSSVGKAKQS